MAEWTELSPTNTEAPGSNPGSGVLVGELVGKVIFMFFYADSNSVGIRARFAAVTEIQNDCLFRDLQRNG